MCDLVHVKNLFFFLSILSPLSSLMPTLEDWMILLNLISHLKFYTAKQAPYYDIFF